MHFLTQMIAYTSPSLRIVFPPCLQNPFNLKLVKGAHRNKLHLQKSNYYSSILLYNHAPFVSSDDTGCDPTSCSPQALLHPYEFLVVMAELHTGKMVVHTEQLTDSRICTFFSFETNTTIKYNY